MKEKAAKKKKLPSRLPFNIYVAAAPSVKKVKQAPPKLPFPKCHLCPLGHSEDFPLVPTESPSIVAHVECGAFINETSVETLYIEEEADGNLSDSKLVAPMDDDLTVIENDSKSSNSILKNSNEVQSTLVVSNSPLLPVSTNMSTTNNTEASLSGPSPDLKSMQNQPPVIAHIGGRETVAEKIRRKLPNIDNSAYKVLGIADIPKERWRLKCAWCQYPEHQKGLGACVQCTRGRCVRAFHVTCALLGNIHLKMDDDGVMECFCSAHDPVVKEERKLLADQNLASIATERFKVGTPVTCRFAGNNYAGVVVECKIEEKGCMTQFEGQYENSLI